MDLVLSMRCLHRGYIGRAQALMALWLLKHPLNSNRPIACLSPVFRDAAAAVMLAGDFGVRYVDAGSRTAVTLGGGAAWSSEVSLAGCARDHPHASDPAGNTATQVVHATAQ